MVVALVRVAGGGRAGEDGNDRDES